MPLYLFWIPLVGTLALLAGVMGWLFIQAREVPDESEKHPRTRRRLNPDQLRLLAYILVALLLLLGAMIELRLFYRQ